MPNRTISNFVGSSGGSSPSAIRKVLVAVGVGATCTCRKADAEMMQVFSKILNRRAEEAMRLRGGEEQLMAVARGNGIRVCNDTFFVEWHGVLAMACWL